MSYQEIHEDLRRQAEGQARHTPGTWSADLTREVSTGDYSAAVGIATGNVLEGTYKNIAAVRFQGDEWLDKDGWQKAEIDGEGAANAQLIAAAPELLAACEKQLAALSGGLLDICKMRDAHRAIEAAVAKAKGGKFEGGKAEGGAE